MRITNTMITSHTKTNINANKLLVDKYNTQMTTQKKIAKASENPVIAIRALRLSTNMTHITQYLDNNITDADAWMDVTETALTNIKELLTDVRTQCVNGSTDTLTTEERESFLESLQSLSEQIYIEGNADYAGKSVFTGYRTSSTLTFDEKEANTKYQITQNLTYKDIEGKRYYTGTVNVPESVTDETPECTTEIAENTYDRLRLAYNGNTELQNVSYKLSDGTEVSLISTTTNKDGTTSVIQSENLKIYDSEDAWEADTSNKEIGKTITPNEVVYIKQTGELIFGSDIANSLADGHADFTIEYTKQGFEKGEVRPEYYYDCVDITEEDPSKHIAYKKENQDINYTIAANVQLTINTQISDVYDSAIARDVDEMISLLTKSNNAQAKVDEIKRMMSESRHSDEKTQAKLQTYLDAAQKELDYSTDNLQRTYGNFITRFDGYLTKVNIAITNVGSMKNRLTMTQTRMETQKMTVEELQTSNEDREISDIIIDYYAAYDAYQSSLTAAGKIEKTSLLDYL